VVNYNVVITLDASGGFSIANPNWNEGSFDLNFACSDSSGNGPTSMGPFGPIEVDTTAPIDPSCTSAPTPANNGTAVTTTCVNVEPGASLSIPNMSCTPDPALPIPAFNAETVVCTGTVGTTTSSVSVSNDTVSVVDPAGNTNTNTVTGLVIDNTPPTGPGSVSAPGTGTNTNDVNEDIVGSCGTDAANGTVLVTTDPANGFTNNYNTAITLDANGDFTIVDPNWADGSYTLSLDCSDEAGNGPTTFGPFGPSTVDTGSPSDPVCSTTPSPASDGTAVTMVCGGVEPGSTVTTPGMTCLPTPADATGQVNCTGVVGAAGLTVSDDIVTVTDSSGNANTNTNTGLIIDNTPPAGPGVLTAPGNTNDPDEDLIGSCGADAANGTVVVTTTPANGFTLQYGVEIDLDQNGDFMILNPNWSEGSFDVHFDCTDEVGNGPTTLGPFGPAVVDPNNPDTPVCTTSPSPAANGTSVTTSCTGVEEGATLSIPNMVCNPDPATAAGSVDCVGTVGTGTNDVSVENDTVTVTSGTGTGTNTSATTGLEIDNEPPTGPGSLSAPGNTNDPNEDIVGSCGLDAANGTVKVTTINPANGFTNMYDTAITLDANGDFTIVDPAWAGIALSYEVIFDCSDDLGNGPTTLGPFGPVVVDPTLPNTPICSTTPTPANDGTSVTMTCTVRSVLAAW